MLGATVVVGLDAALRERGDALVASGRLADRSRTMARVAGDG